MTKFAAMSDEFEKISRPAVGKIIQMFKNTSGTFQAGKGAAKGVGKAVAKPSVRIAKPGASLAVKKPAGMVPKPTAIGRSGGVGRWGRAALIGGGLGMIGASKIFSTVANKQFQDSTPYRTV